MDLSGRKLSVDATWSLLLKLFGATSGLLVLLVLARLLPLADVGNFLLAQSLAVVFAMIARFGMKQPVVALIAAAIADDEEAQIGKILKSIAIVVLIGLAMFIFAMTLGGAELLFLNMMSSPELLEVFFLWALLVIILAVQAPVADAFRGMQLAKEAMLFDGPLSNFLFLVVLAIILVMAGTVSLHKVLLLLCACSIVSLLFSISALAKRISGKARFNGLLPLRPLFSAGAPVLLVNVSTYVASHSSLWICGAFLAAIDTALFGATLRLILVISLPLFVLNMVIQPQIVHLHKTGKLDLLQQYVRRATTIATLTSLLGSLVIFSCPSFILNSLFGSEFIDAKYVLILLTFGQLVNVLAGPCLNYLLLVGRRGVAGVVVLMSSSVTVLASIAVVGDYGMEGVAAVSVIGLLLQNGILLLVIRKADNITTASFLHPGCVAGALKGLAIKFPGSQL